MVPRWGTTKPWEYSRVLTRLAREKTTTQPTTRPQPDEASSQPEPDYAYQLSKSIRASTDCTCPCLGQHVRHRISYQQLSLGTPSSGHRTMASSKHSVTTTGRFPRRFPRNFHCRCRASRLSANSEIHQHSVLGLQGSGSRQTRHRVALGTGVSVTQALLDGGVSRPGKSLGTTGFTAGSVVPCSSRSREMPEGRVG